MVGIPYFYIIRHKPTGKYYAGCKISLTADSSNLMTENGYKTTSKIVKEIIKTDGLISFEILRIKHFDSIEKTLNYETRFLAKVNAAENEMFINRHNGGKNFCNKGGYNLTESTKQKMRKPKSSETIEKQNNAKKERGQEVYKKMVETRRRNHSTWHNEEMIEIIRKSNAVRWADDSNRQKHSEIMKEYYKDNPISSETRKKLSDLNSGENNKMFGKKHSEETKQKMRLAWKKRKNKEE